MYICSVCDFSSRVKRSWDRHHILTGHQQEEEPHDGSPAEVSNEERDSSPRIPSFSRNIEGPFSSPTRSPVSESHGRNDVMGRNDNVIEDWSNDGIVDQGIRSDDENELNDNFQNYNTEEIPEVRDEDSRNEEAFYSNDDPNPRTDPWFPFKSRAHFYLVTLYHGSHRRNFDQVTLSAIMDILRIYVPFNEYFPTVKEVVEFECKFWEEKIFESRVEGENILSFLKPQGMVALRLSNPRFAHAFDRVPRKNSDESITTQSSAEKFKMFDFRKLGDLLKGDMLTLSQKKDIFVEGVGKVPCQVYFFITGFFIQDGDYKVQGKYFFHSSQPEIVHIRNQIGDMDCFILVENFTEDLFFDDVNKLEYTFRHFNIVEPTFSRLKYDERYPSDLSSMSHEEFEELTTSLKKSLDEGCVNVVVNVHIDDASQVQSKMWKSASVFNLQLAGAMSGVKGNEHNNIILSLSDTSKISLKRLFESMCGELRRGNEEGFECFDCFSGKVEKVKIPVAAVLGDLPAKCEITPFKGYQADVFCPRDMYNKRTDTGLEVRRDLELVKRQVNEIKNEQTVSGKRRLGVEYGIDEKNLECILFDLSKFDLTKDLPLDLLHHFLLGWGKKSFIALKNDILTQNSLNKLCEILDNIIWKEYKSRTNTNALKKAGSQIGRNLKSFLQVLWYGIWILTNNEPGTYRVELETFIRAFYYLGKINNLFFNESEVQWNLALRTELSDSIQTVVAIFKRNLEVIVPGPKTHDLEHHILEDLLRHGNPSSFDCQAGESKMKVQKLKNNYSNKAAPGTDVAKKYMRTEIVRHIASGGSLSEDGKVKATQMVLDEAVKHTSIRNILGFEVPQQTLGTSSLFDYETLNGRRKLKKQKPEYQHVAIGVPDEIMKTCRKIVAKNGPLYRDGGLYVYHENIAKLGILLQVYKSQYDVFAVVELLEDVSAEKGDPFLTEANIKVWKRTNELFVLSDLSDLDSVPLLHACSAEEGLRCDFKTELVDVVEERKTVKKNKRIYKCLGRSGTYFLVNSLAFSIPPSYKL